MQYKILIVEDESDINGLLAKILEEAEYLTVQAFSGTEAKLLLEKEIPDLILLDLMLPGISGEELLYDIRENKHYNVPVLVLSAQNSLGHKVSLLKDGADDYITKPFEPEEVIARIQSVLRRIGKEYSSEKILTYKNLHLYPQARKVTLDGTEIELTAHEYDILYLFMQNPEKVYSRESLYELVWHGGYYGENNTVNVHVSNLRKKLKEADSKEDYIQTVYGIGFKFQ
ncbi:MAG: DNA-binding response regulator [Clostridiaceae bacterium]|jgi:DNA-binding response OmpR family regulator|nr:DNA-binding response regulator [Clostridiaceae bacterium]